MKRGLKILIFFLLVILIGVNIGVIMFFMNFNSESNVNFTGQATNQGQIGLTVESNSDITFPNVAIIYPGNTSYSSHITDINYTLSDNRGFDSCWYSIDQGETNTSIVCGENVTGISSVSGSNEWRVYVKDIGDNVNYSSVVFSVSIPSSPSGESGGGGGGGGGGGIAAVITGVKDDFELNPSEININLISNSKEERDIKLINNKDDNLTISVEIEGINELIGINTDEFILMPGEEKNLVLSIFAPERGIYSGKIIFKSENTVKELLISINIKSKDSGIDLLVNVLENGRKVEVKNNMSAFVDVEFIGTVDETNFTVNYVIKDFNGKIYYEETEILNYDPRISYNKEFDTSNLPLGRYIIGIEVIYSDGFTSSSDRFDVIEKRININMVLAVTLGVLVILIILISIIIYMIKRNDKYEKS